MSPIKKALQAGANLRKRKTTSDKPTAAGFSAFRKRTITAREFAKAMGSIAANSPTMYKVWVKKELDPGFREELMLAVAKLNGCMYCSWAHHEWASIDGIPEEELAQIEQMDPAHFDRKKWLAISYVRELVSSRFAPVSVDLEKKMRQHYSDTEITEIQLVAKVMDAANLGANTFEAMRWRLRGTPVKGSRLFDEVMLSAAFFCIVPPVVVFLARSSKRSVREMTASLIDYTRKMDAKAH
jgi:AhpD family alkylhydroperoxidase